MTLGQRVEEGWDAALLLVLSAVIFLSPLIHHPLWNGGFLIHQQPYGSFHLRNTLILIPLDILQGLLVILSVPKLISLIRSRRFNWSTIAAFALVAVAIVSWAFHPSIPGIARIVRWIAAGAVVVAASRLDRRSFRIHVGLPLLATAAIQATIALGQYFGSRPASSDDAILLALARGTTAFPYVVGFVLLVGLTVGVALMPDDRTRPLWIAGIALCSAGIATSLMRTAVVGLAVAWIAYGFLVFRDQHRYRSVLAATVLPFAVVAVAIGDPWLRKLQQTFGIGYSGSLSAAEVISTGRLKLIRHSLTIIADAPFVGVGPAREAIEAAARFPDEYKGVSRVDSVHVVPLLVAAEMGIAAGVAYLGYLIALGWRSLRTSPEAVAVFASVGVFMLLETMPYDRPTSIILVGVWMATLDHLSAGRSAHVIPSSMV